jgi:hypothetical protein
MRIPQPKAPGMFDYSPDQDRGNCRGRGPVLDGQGLFIGQSPEFFELLRDLAEDADEARRGGG